MCDEASKGSLNALHTVAKVVRQVRVGLALQHTAVGRGTGLRRSPDV